MECLTCTHCKNDGVPYCELTGKDIEEHEDECVNKESDGGK